MKKSSLSPFLVAVATFALHAACGGGYGVFRDELYFIVCGERLGVGYVDQPPVIAVIARIAHALFGMNAFGLRVIPWIASAATVFLAGRLAMRISACTSSTRRAVAARGAFSLGFSEGKWSSPPLDDGDGERHDDAARQERSAVVAGTIAAIATAASPLLLGLGHLLTMNAFEPLLWVAIALTVTRIVLGTGSPRRWLLVGVLVAIAVLNKYSAALFVITLAFGLLLSPARRVLKSIWLLAAIALAALLVLPNLLWQVQHGLPFLELVHNGQAHKNAELSLPKFFLELVLEPNPIAAPLWIGGLFWLFTSKRARPVRFLGGAAFALIVVFAATHAKPYYVGPLFPILFAAGSAAIAPVLQRRTVLTATTAAALVLVGAIGWPFALPLLQRETFVAYRQRLGIHESPTEKHQMGALPQTFADMHGWKELAAAVDDVARTLTPKERAQAIVFGQNYGEASAVVLYGGPDTPPAISGHNQYWLWGIPEGRGAVAIVISDEHEDCGKVFKRKELARKLPANPWVMPYEDQRFIWICREPTQPLQSLWPSLREYI